MRSSSHQLPPVHNMKINKERERVLLSSWKLKYQMKIRALSFLISVYGWQHRPRLLFTLQLQLVQRRQGTLVQLLGGSKTLQVITGTFHPRPLPSHLPRDLELHVVKQGVFQGRKTVGVFLLPARPGFLPRGRIYWDQLACRSIRHLQ